MAPHTDVETAVETHDAAPGELLRPFLEWAVTGVNAAGAGVLIWGVAAGLIAFFRMELRRCSRSELDGLRHDLRKTVGFYILLGLELLIAADIIETMLEPTLEHLAILGGVVGIRIATSYALGKELEHGAPTARNGKDQA